jgi:putative ABC transport system permease protein
MGYFQYAFRNILLHRRRSWVTLLAVTFGFTALGVFGGMVNNIFQRLKDQAITVEKLGHLTVAKDGFFMNGKMEPEKYLWTQKESEEILDILRKDSSVTLATPRLRLFGIASNGKASTLFLSEAVVPEDDQILTGALGPTGGDVSGIVTLRSEDGESVAIGSELSSILGVGEEQYLTLLTNTATGMANAVDAKVTEVYNTGNPATNDKFVLLPYDLAASLYDAQGAERIVIMLKNEGDIEEERERLIQLLASSGHAVEMRTWNELSLFYERVTVMFGVIFRVISVIITLVVLLTLLNTIFMSVAERTREIGTLRAMGLRQRAVLRIFQSEGIILALTGITLSIPILLSIQALFGFLKVSFIPPVASAPVMIMLVFKPAKLAAVTVMFCIAAVFASTWASRGAAKKQIVDALAHH